MKTYVWSLIAGCAILWWPAIGSAASAERAVRPVQFARGSSSAVLKGTITGYNHVDYHLQAGAGQRMQVSMRGSNGANYFNVLPPGSQDVAMFTDGAGDTTFNGLLPDDGTYAVRVYLVRAAARRGESSQYTLSISITGSALPPLPPSADAVIPGTRFHARAPAKCEPAYSKQRECDAWVIRRGTDGTATVELRWEKGQKRRILFVKGKPEVADVPRPFTFTRDARGYVVSFGQDERFEIPEPLVFSG